MSAKGVGDYAATDKASPNTVYYRLRMIDNDETYSYSPVAVVSNMGHVVSRAYYDFMGRRLPGPVQGFYILVSTLDTGEVRHEKIYQQ